MWVQATKENIKVGMRVRVKNDVARPYYGWGNINPTDIGTIVNTEIGNVKVNFLSNKAWLAHNVYRVVISEMEVEIVETKSKLEQLEETIAKAQQEIKELRESEEKAKRPLLEMGQVWKHFRTGYYMVSRSMFLISLSSGNIWDSSIRGFGGADEAFTYVGLAEDLVQIKES